MRAMIILQTRLFPLFVLTLLVFQQGCITKTPLPLPPSEPYQVADRVEPPAGEDSEMIAELKIPEPQLTLAPIPSLSPQPREPLPESLLGAPEQDLAARALKYDTVLALRAPDTPAHLGWQFRNNQQGQIVGFEFSNRGGNRILPHHHDIGRQQFFSRDFQFRFDDRARQDIHLHISDWVPSRDRLFRLSDIMNSIILVFPRNYLPAIVRSRDRLIVTLPTGEVVEFDATTHEVAAGVFSETPVDLNPNRGARKFPGIHYLGRGVLVRADARGADPRIGTMATIVTGSPPSHCRSSTGCKQCQVPSKELWEQKGAVRFKFSTDEEFDRYLRSRCGFGLPSEIS